MKYSIFFLVFIISIQLKAQTTLYAISKSTPIKRTYISRIDPATGYVSVSPKPLASDHMGLGSGNFFNFDDGLYYFLNGNSGLTSVDVHTGASKNISINQIPLLISPQYACRDLSVYGFRYSRSSTSSFGKFDLDSGKFFPPLLSFSTIPGDDYTYDKINHRYLFVSGTSLISIDLNTMTRTTIALPISFGSDFRFPQYDCVNSLVYGSLIGPTGVFLVSFDLKTGKFTKISGAPFTHGGILGGGTALDVKKGLYYYNAGTSILSVKLSDGKLLSNMPYTFSIPQPTVVYYIELDQTCNCESPVILGEDENNFSEILIMNPFTTELKIFGITSPAYFRLYDVTSRLLIERKIETDLSLNTAELQKGIYLFTLDQNGRRRSGKLIKE